MLNKEWYAPWIWGTKSTNTFVFSQITNDIHTFYLKFKLFTLTWCVYAWIRIFLFFLFQYPPTFILGSFAKWQQFYYMSTFVWASKMIPECIYINCQRVWNGTTERKGKERNGKEWKGKGRNEKERKWMLNSELMCFHKFWEQSTWCSKTIPCLH